ncbi:hypothetical protein BDN70DRAFT_874290 [Pholiota conissans]|uniref:Uncharacterized protein n=1 Tax=Pholiota conissans TaxID=109636 RepID=A0A9P5Z7V7_9AGAR|nr:hypothetical protein BDN70DRAFT_874290 [Pholiota conissans]
MRRPHETKITLPTTPYTEDAPTLPDLTLSTSETAPCWTLVGVYFLFLAHHSPAHRTHELVYNPYLSFAFISNLSPYF